MTLFVLVAVHNRRAFTQQFIESVRAQTCHETVRMCVVDDGSADGTAEFLAAQTDVEVIRGDGNLWWSGAVRRGLEHLREIAGPADWIYLGNNDTVLDAHHFSVLLEAAAPKAIVGSVAKEIWPDGTVNPVSAGFRIDRARLVVENLKVDSSEPVDALAGRGLLLPISAADSHLLTPHRMPQHFADLAFTSALKRRGWHLQVATAAQSTQLERAGSSVELAPHLKDFASKKSQMYLPALWNFWWDLSTPRQRLSLPLRFANLGVRQLVSGAYR